MHFRNFLLKRWEKLPGLMYSLAQSAEKLPGSWLKCPLLPTPLLKNETVCVRCYIVGLRCKIVGFRRNIDCRRVNIDCVRCNFVCVNFNILFKIVNTRECLMLNNYICCKICEICKICKIILQNMAQIWPKRSFSCSYCSMHAT